jgi:hypothetical protein
MFLLLPFAAMANEFERPCALDDVLGTWELVATKAIRPPPPEYADLLQPYQMISYGIDHTFRRVTFNKRIEQGDALRLLALAPPERFRVQRMGWIAIADQAGRDIAGYGCSLFIADNPSVNITKGTLSLLWSSGGAPVIIQAFRRVGPS